ncbi:MAG: metallophosphoesterase, partial [Bacteroidota bacterium]|nr:metallophosphoesterase [Bacteroidota bacterium]
MRSPTFVAIILAIMILLDAYVFQAIKVVSSAASPKTKTIIYSVYWAISIIAIFGFLIFVLTGPDFLPKKVRTYLFATVVGLFFGKLISVIFFLIDDVRRLIQWVAGKLLFRNTEGEQLSEDGISRSTFLSWFGLAAGGTLFSSLVYGFSNKYNYEVRRVRLAFDNLPASFKGLKIVHISDIHSGSFTNKAAVARGVQKILNENADLILFSGDLVNDRATEMEEYMDVFSKLKA